MILTFVVLIIGLLTVLASFVALLHGNIKVAILASGIVSLMASVLYAVLDAPDVALTEAAIGSAITTFIFFVVLRKISRVIEDGKEDI